MKKFIFLGLLALMGIGFVSYKATMSLFSNTGQSTNNTFTVSETFPTPTPQIVINEVSSGGNNNSEWVELYNNSVTSATLDGWTIQDNDSSEIDTLPSGTIPAGGYGLILTNNTTVPGTPAGAIIFILSDNQIGNGLNNNGDRLTLRDSLSNIIDQMNYGDDSTFFVFSSVPSSSATSARNPNGQDTNTGADWIIDLSPSIGVSN